VSRVLLLSCSFAGVLWGFRDDERRTVINAHPKLVAHVADRVAADLAQVCVVPCALCFSLFLLLPWCAAGVATEKQLSVATAGRAAGALPRPRASQCLACLLYAAGVLARE